MIKIGGKICFWRETKCKRIQVSEKGHLSTRLEREVIFAI